MNRSSSIEEQEEQMMIHLDNLSIPSFLFFFNLYLCANPNTPNTLFLKTAALLSYISEGNNTEFNRLVQTVSMQERSSDLIELVLEVRDCIFRFDFEFLKELCEHTTPKLNKLLLKILNEQKGQLEKSLGEPIGSCSNMNISYSATTTIKDCIFVVQNFNDKWMG